MTAKLSFLLFLAVAPLVAFACADVVLRQLVLDFRSAEQLASFYQQPRFEELLKVVLLSGEVVELETKLGEGNFGVVFPLRRKPSEAPESRRRVIKIAKTEEKRKSLESEMQDSLRFEEVEVAIAPILNRGDQPLLYLVKEEIVGPTALELRQTNGFTAPMIADLAGIFVKVSTHHLCLDAFKAENIVWDIERQQMVLVDTALRTRRFYLNEVSINEWEQTFFTREEDRQAFRLEVDRIGGAGFAARAQEAFSRAAGLNHALRQEIDLIFGPQ